MSRRKKIPRYEVIRDTREQSGWTFAEDNDCTGTVIDTLKTGDYSLRGLENLFTIERKGKCQEFAQNILEDRFEREFERMESFPCSFLFLEFTMKDIMNYPHNQGIPLYLIKKIQVRPEFILSKLLDYNIKYKTKTFLVGQNGKEVAKSLFRKMTYKYTDIIESVAMENEKTETE